MFLIRAGAIDGFERLVSQLGGNPAELLRDAGFSSAQLRQPNTYLSYGKLATLLDHSASLCQEPLFGLRLAAGQGLMVLGELALSVSQQASLGDALAFYDQHAHLHAHGSHLKRRLLGEQVEYQLSFDFSNESGLLHLTQLSIGQLYNGVRHLVEHPGQQLRVHLQQARPAGALWRWPELQGRLVFDSHLDGISFPSHWLARKPLPVDTLLREHFQQRTRLLEARYPDNLQAQICHVISNLLPYGECSLARVGAALDLHPRVLQKRLQREGTGFAQLLQETRLETAQQHLLHSRLSITELALSLGYAEAAVFSRNFKRCTGLSPRQWRERQCVKTPD